MAQDLFDPDVAALEYQDEIFEYAEKLQDEMLPDPNYIVNIQNNNLSWEMRSQLILWIVEVHSRFSLRLEALFLAVNYLDRFLSCKEVSSDRLQLVGIVALSIAAKYEDQVTIKGLREICDGIYQVDDFVKAEFYILDKLEYKLGWPGPLIFLRRVNLEVDSAEPTSRTLAEFFLETILPDQSLIAKTSSIIAAAVYCLARCMLGIGEWVRRSQQRKSYKESKG